MNLDLDKIEDRLKEFEEFNKFTCINTYNLSEIANYEGKILELKKELIIFKRNINKIDSELDSIKRNIKYAKQEKLFNIVDDSLKVNDVLIIDNLYSYNSTILSNLNGINKEK